MFFLFLFPQKMVRFFIFQEIPIFVVWFRVCFGFFLFHGVSLGRLSERRRKRGREGKQREKEGRGKLSRRLEVVDVACLLLLLLRAREN